MLGINMLGISRRSSLYSGVRLAQFILANLQPLLDDWEQFARTIAAASELDRKGLRDHAEQMLRDIASDLSTGQTYAEQLAKSRGEADATIGDTAAETHAGERHAQGFDISQMVTEYRALRATVVRQLMSASWGDGAEDLRDLVRFNEAIDQAQTESITRFMRDLDASRELLLGTLGHDLRTPVAAILQAGVFLQRSGGLTPKQEQAATIIATSGARVGKLANNLLEMARVRLGSRMTIARTPLDLDALCNDVIAECSASRPGHTVVLNTNGDTRGEWDDVRLAQLLSNLLENSFKYGEPGVPITVTLHANAAAVRVSVQNFGPVIPPGKLDSIFQPFNRGGAGEGELHSGDGFGLGLYIAWEIARAHGGEITVTSTIEAGTNFDVRLPRGGALATQSP
jgi:signal transduction histidine kinase